MCPASCTPLRQHLVVTNILHVNYHVWKLLLFCVCFFKRGYCVYFQLHSFYSWTLLESLLRRFIYSKFKIILIYIIQGFVVAPYFILWDRRLFSFLWFVPPRLICPSVYNMEINLSAPRWRTSQFVEDSMEEL